MCIDSFICDRNSLIFCKFRQKSWHKCYADSLIDILNIMLLQSLSNHHIFNTIQKFCILLEFNDCLQEVLMQIMQLFFTFLFTFKNNFIIRAAQKDTTRFEVLQSLILACMPRNNNRRCAATFCGHSTMTFQFPRINFFHRITHALGKEVVGRLSCCCDTKRCICFVTRGTTRRKNVRPWYDLLAKRLCLVR